MKNINLPSALALLGVVAMAGAQSARANLVTNGGFETGDFSGWTLSGNFSSGYPDYTSVSPINVMRPSGGNWDVQTGPYQLEDYLSQTLSTTAGADYKIDFLLKNVGGPGIARFDLNWGGVTVFSITDNSGFEWEDVTYTETASAASTLLSFGFRNDSTYFYLDNVSVTPIVASSVPDSGTTASLLGLAMLGLAAARRKLS